MGFLAGTVKNYDVAFRLNCALCIILFVWLSRSDVRKVPYFGRICAGIFRELLCIEPNFTDFHSKAFYESANREIQNKYSPLLDELTVPKHLDMKHENQPSPTIIEF